MYQKQIISDVVWMENIDVSELNIVCVNNVRTEDVEDA